MRLSDQAWIIHVYSLALIFALPLAGPLADRFGRRRLFMYRTIAFALSSVMCAMATSLFSLLAWRVLQGIAGAALTASSAALLAAAFLGPRRPWAFGILGTVIGTSMVAGPPLGALIAAMIGWQRVFWVNLPICQELVLLTRRTQNDQAPAAPQTSLAAATGMLLTALTIPMFLLPSVGAKLATKLPARRYFTGGLLIIGGADLILALASRELSSPNAIWIVVVALLIGRAGCAMFNSQITAAAVSAIPQNKAATAAAISVTMRQIGFALGITLIGALLQRSDRLPYSTAFVVVAVCTLGLAAIVFALLSRPE